MLRVDVKRLGRPFEWMEQTHLSMGKKLRMEQ